MSEINNSGNTKTSGDKWKFEKIKNDVWEFEKIKTHKQEEKTGDLTMSGEINIDFNWTEKGQKVFAEEILKSMENNNFIIFSFSI